MDWIIKLPQIKTVFQWQKQKSRGRENDFWRRIAPKFKELACSELPSSTQNGLYIGLNLSITSYFNFWLLQIKFVLLNWQLELSR